jgi:hypothetical protein
MISALAVAILCSIGWFLCFMASHITLMHVGHSARFSTVIVRCFAFSTISCIGTIVCLKGYLWDAPALGWIVAIGAAVLLMCCAFILYMPLVFTVSNSITGDTLMWLDQRDGGTPRDQLYSVFVSTSALQARLKNMNENNLVSLQGCRYRLTEKGTSVARFFRAMKELWRLGPGG